MHEDKHETSRTCNRSACGKPGAVYYNLSTHAYYCPRCARLINEANPGCCVLPWQRYQCYRLDPKKPYVTTVNIESGGDGFLFSKCKEEAEFIETAVKLFNAVSDILQRAEIYGLMGATNHPAVKCEVKGLTLGDWQKLEELVKPNRKMGL